MSIHLLEALLSYQHAGQTRVGLLTSQISCLHSWICLQEHQLRPIRVQNGREPGDTSGPEQLGPLHMLLFGALSGASAEAVVYPMEVIRRRMQVQAASASSAGTACAFGCDLALKHIVLGWRLLCPFIDCAPCALAG